MNKIKLLLILGVFLVGSIFQTTIHAQFKDYSFKIGLNGNYLDAHNEYGGSGFLGRTYLRLQLNQSFDMDFGLGYGSFGGDDYGGNEYKTEIIPIDFRLLFTPWDMESWNPYIYVGLGGTFWWLDNPPKFPARPPADKYEAFSFLVPLGIGTEIALSKNWIIDASLGWNAIISDWPNGLATNEQDIWNHDWDRYVNIGIGIAYVGENCDADPDNDGLGNCQEKELGTDPYNADTDGDGLTDGEEVLKYNTDPMNPDSDGEGLNDGAEVKSHQTDPNKADTDGDGLNDYAEVVTHMTDPLNMDTDGEGLNDGDEVNTHKTDPNKADTDGDGLNDHAEITNHKTDPLNKDTDGDMLSDGDEVMKHKTNPLAKDTDGGTVNDGVEVERGTDPLDPADDVIKIDVAVVYEGINFELNSAEISSSGEDRLQQALHALKTHPNIIVEIRGYCDNTGLRSYNMSLSQKRAESVKNWLIENGIKSDRLTAKGFGPDNPIATNKTLEGRRQNRRIEFVRTK